MDTLSQAERSKLMSRVRSTNTAPERVVRGLAHRMGHRFRLHRRDLPGSPDLVFVSLRKIVFVHGCFWHQHNCPAGRRMPKTRTAFWRGKLLGNQTRDRRTIARLRRLGWRVLVVWECQVDDTRSLAVKLRAFLGRRRRRRPPRAGKPPKALDGPGHV
jgi:DNA mismatch endonuclease, patch repair protein